MSGRDTKEFDPNWNTKKLLIVWVVTIIVILLVYFIGGS